MDWFATALGVAEGICRWHMGCIVVNIKGIKLTINNCLPAETVNDQVSLKRQLIFRRQKLLFIDVNRIALLIKLKTTSSCGGLVAQRSR